jgi:hypothetical protein
MITTVTVDIIASILIGGPFAAARVRFELTRLDVEGALGLVVPAAQTVVLDDLGEGAVELFPNALGNQATQYKVTITDRYGQLQWSGFAVVPNEDCMLHEILSFDAIPPIDAAQAAVLEAQAQAALAQKWATQTFAEVVAGQGYGAKKYAEDAAADSLQTAADRAATAADRSQTNSDQAATEADRSEVAADRIITTAARDEAVAAKDIAVAAAAAVPALAAEIDAAQGDIDAHEARVDNPHAVTKAQVELDLVENKSSATIRGELTSQNVTAALGFTPENAANKSTSILVDGASNVKYPSAKAVKDYADGLVVGLWDDRGNFDASVNAFPAGGGSGADGAVLKGDIWTVSVAGVLGGVPVAARQTIRAMVDTPGQLSANWAIGLANTDVDDSITDGVTGRAPSQNAVADALALKASVASLQAHATDYSNSHGVTKAQVGLGSADDTSDADKPVSTAQAAAIAAGDAATLANAKSYTDGATAGTTAALNTGDAATLVSAKAYADGLVVGLLDDRGSYDASTNTFPVANGSGAAGAILKGDLWYISVAGTLGGVLVAPGYSVRALVNAPGQTAANWDILNVGLGYVPENAASKNASGGYAGLTQFKLNLRNAANTVTSWFTTAATAARTWTLPDKDGTVAMTSDVDAAQAAAVQRANHTGTQLAATISDFASTVRGTALTGLSTAAGTIVTAAHSVLQAIGFLQKQVSDNLTTLTSHTGNTANPHGTTKAHVGLGSADNTSDANKPISTATQAALNAKANASGGTLTTPTLTSPTLTTEAVAVTTNNLPLVRPSLLIDFANSKTVDPRIVFTRASVATYFDCCGVLRTALAGEPRIDHDPVTLACLGIPIEEQRTNSIRNNTMVGAVAGVLGAGGAMPIHWSALAAGLTIEVIGTGTINGVSYIDLRFSGTATSGLFNISPEGSTSIVAVVGQKWSTFIYMALVGGTLNGLSNFTPCLMREYTAVGGNLGDVTGSNVDSIGQLTSTLTKFTVDGGELVQAGVERLARLVRFSSQIGAVIDVTLRVGMPQVELGAFATSVIPTAGAEVTRVADVPAMTGANFSNWYRPDEGTFVISWSTVWGAAAGGGSTRVFTLSNGTNNERFIGYTQLAVMISGGVTVGATAGQGAVLDPTGATAAWAYKSNAGGFSKNGAAEATDNTFSLPVGLNQLHLGNNSPVTGTVVLNGHIKSLRYYPQRLTAAQLQAITTP